MEKMEIEELLAVKVRLMPYFVEREGPYMAQRRPDSARSRIVDRLQARAILRLFDDFFKVDILPSWWTVHDDYRISHRWKEHPALHFEEVQQMIIEEGPEA